MEVMTNVDIAPGTELATALEGYRRLTTEESTGARVEAAKNHAKRARALTAALDKVRSAFRAAPRRCVVAGTIGGITK